MTAARIWPKPRCCNAIRRFPIVHAQADILDDGAPVIRWVWHAFHQPGRERALPSYRAADSLWKAPGPTHCPFCQAQLPGFELRKPPVVTCEPSDYYCGTCEERLHACECLPLECRWKVKRCVTTSN